MESKVAALGGSDFVMPFSALGLDTFVVDIDNEQIAETAEKILSQRYGLIVVAENVAQAANEVFQRTLKQAVPCVVVVPFTTKSEGFATEALGRVLKMATGIDVFSNS
jgi:vacuolar-type H+-ATPase subunit F/Vma7